MCASLGLKEFDRNAELANVRQNNTLYFVYHYLTAGKQKCKTLGTASVEVQPSRISTPTPQQFDRLAPAEVGY